jgi:outer membrane protein OmpA-like peptidoglycan-associated protein
MKKQIYFLMGIAVFIGMISGPGCATKKYLQGELVTVDQKVEDISNEVEGNQKRLKEHDERLASIGSIIKEHESHLKSVDGKIDSKIEEVRKYARGNLIFKETLRNNEAKFKFDSYELSAEAMEILDNFVKMLISQDKGRYLEIQGHTDSSGSESWNLLLGKKRAEAVMEYLYKTHHIPLHRMEVISFGSTLPVADNSTREGRAQNRRVDILVYE